MQTDQICPKCGSSVRRIAAGGVCPRCLLESALSEPVAGSPSGSSGEQGGEPASALGRLGRYELLKEIAHGGMGVVYRARDASLNRIVAVKLMLAGQFASDRELKRFRTEAEAAARLDHPNIVPIYEYGELEGRPFLSMRFVEGANLAHHLHGTPMDATATAQLMSTLARAVHYAHQRGILHRDLKPANVLMDLTGQPHVTDFGLAKCLDSNEGLTLSGATLGSPNYMPPEQAAGHPERLTTAADIYSLGAIMYELLTGRAPFRSETPLETMRKVMDEPPIAPHLLHKFADRELETICLKCMEKEPTRRYGSAEALAEDLERWLRREPILARRIGTLGRFAKWASRNPATATLLLVSTLAVIGFVVGQTFMGVRLRRANAKVTAANVDLSRSLYEMRWRQADDAALADEHGEAIAQFSRFLREHPNDPTAAARLLSLLSSCNFPVLLVPPLVHEAPVVAMDFARDGSRLVTATAGGTVRLWDVASGKMELELAHPAPVAQSLLCGQEDQRLLTLSAEPKVRLWDLVTRRLVSELQLGPINPLHTWRGVLGTRARHRLAINTQSNVVQVLDVDAGEWLQPPATLPVEICRFAISADGKLLALTSASQLILRQWGSEQPLFDPVALATPAEDIHFSDDGHWVACLCQNTISLINTATGRRESEFSANAFRIAFLGATDRLITIPSNPTAPLGLIDPHTGKDCGSPFGQAEFNSRWHDSLFFSFRELKSYFPSTLHLLEPDTGRFQTEPFIHDGPISGARLSSDGRVVATASQDRTVRLWSPQMRPPQPLTLTPGRIVWEAQWHPSGQRILSTGRDGTNSHLLLSDARTGASLCPAAPLDGETYFAQWSPDGTRLATVSQTAAVLWDGQTAQPLCPPLRHEGTRMVHSAFSTHGELLATAAEDNTIRLWDAHTGRAVNPPLLHSHTPLKISFNSDGRRLASACMDGTIRVWSVPDGKLLLGPLHHSGICWVASFSPNDRWLVSASSDNTAQVWDAASGQPVLPPFRHEGPVMWATFSPNGRAIATSTEFGTARIWDTVTGQLLAGPMHHPGRLWFIKWSPDGHFVATTSTDGTARVWDARTGHLMAEPFRHDAEVRRAEFSPDGHRLLTAAYDGKVKIWDLSLLQPPLPVPDWLPTLAESLGGKRVGLKDSLESVPGDTFQLVKATVDHWNKSDYYGRWAHWLLDERFERPVKPFQP